MSADEGRPGCAEAGENADSRPDTFVSDLFAWLNAVMADHELPALSFAVAYAIGQHFDRVTRLAWPSQPRVAAMVGRNEKNIRPAIRALIARHHLAVAKNRGGGGSTQYRLPEVNRAKPSGSTNADAELSRAEAPGSEVSQSPSNRAKSLGLGEASRRVNRAKSSGQTGQNRPANQSKEPISCSAAAQPRRAAARIDADRQYAESEPSGEAASVASADRRTALADRWRDAIGPDLAAKLGATERLHAAIERGEFTGDDVSAAILDWRRAGTRTPRSWAFFERWASTAAASREAGPARRASFHEFDAASLARPRDAIETPNGGWRSRAQFVAERERWDSGFTWDLQTFGDPPDSPYTVAPADLRGPRKRRQSPSDTAPLVQDPPEES